MYCSIEFILIFFLKGTYQGASLKNEDLLRSLQQLRIEFDKLNRQRQTNEEKKKILDVDSSEDETEAPDPDDPDYTEFTASPQWRDENI